MSGLTVAAAADVLRERIANTLVSMPAAAAARRSPDLDVVAPLAAIDAVLAALSTPPADDVREALESLLENYISGTWSIHVANAIFAAFEVRPRGTVTDAEVNEAPQALLNEFYVSGLRKAIAIIQGEDYPLSNGLARVSSMVSDIEDEIAMEEEVQLREADVVVRWLTRFAERGIVTIGGKGGALETAREVHP